MNGSVSFQNLIYKKKYIIFYKILGVQEAGKTADGTFEKK